MADEDPTLEQELETDTDLDTGSDQELDTHSGPSLRDAFVARGFQLPDEVDDDTLVNHITGGFQRLSKLPSDEELAELRQLADLGRRQLQSQGQTEQPEAKAEEPARKKWAAPALPEGWRNDVEIDFATGQIKAKNPNYPNVAAMEAARKFVAHRNTVEERLYTDPLALLEEAGLGDRFAALKKEMRDEILNEIQWRQQQEGNEQYLNNFFAERQAELYSVRKDGSPVINFLTGQPVLSEKGQLFQQAVAQGQRYGIFDQRSLAEFAWAQVEAAFPAKKRGKAQQEDSQEQEEDEGQSVLRGFVQRGKDAQQRQVSTRLQNRDSTVRKAVQNRQEQQNERLDAKQMMRSELKRRGIG